ncbi:MAG TPA: hypothetical protein VLW86_10330 [Syntrophorhabdales bacterium]|nr:hypothetical protein [Syntrophorhabdales bacterium]
MNKVALVLILMLAAPTVCLVTALQGSAAAQSPLDPPIEKGYWQYGVDSGQGAVKLFIRDKLGQVGDYRALFVVIAPDRREYSAEKNGSLSAEVAASFPSDFGGAWKQGVYAWRCTIGGRTIAQGSFQYCTSCQIRLLQAGISPVRSAGR